MVVVFSVWLPRLRSLSDCYRKVREFFCRLLTPTLSSFEEERENYFAGRLPGVVTPFQPRANVRCPVRAIQGMRLMEHVWNRVPSYCLVASQPDSR
jgi:hypothetical protein